MPLPLSHRFAQELGSLLDDLVLNHLLQPRLQAFAESKHFYLDWKRTRKPRRGCQIGWADAEGNLHDPDFVIESGGNASVVGTPVAFIEALWRSSTPPASCQA